MKRSRGSDNAGRQSKFYTSQVCHLRLVSLPHLMQAVNQRFNRNTVLAGELH